MSKNEGTLDRTLRGIFGLILIILPLATTMPLFASPLAYWAALVVGAVLLITAITGFCPAYRLLGLKTCRDC